MECCKKYYDCKRCHNDAEDHEVNADTIDKIKCDVCNVEQPPSNKCTGCGIEFGTYACMVCKIFESNSGKRSYHCDGCKICRVIGSGSESNFHCEVCDCCFPIETKEGHKCKTNLLNNNCPICLEYLYTSMESTYLMKCGHTIHGSCLKEYTISGNYKCPTCRKSIGDMQSLFEFLDREIELTPMPDEYKEVPIRILCNDCGVQSETFFHVVALKCKNCGSYNTMQI